MFAPPICRRRWRNNAFPFRELRRRRRQPSEYRSELQRAIEIARDARGAQKSAGSQPGSRLLMLIMPDGGEKDRHDAQDDGQDEVEQKDSERCKEAELEGCACADPDFLRRRRTVSHVPTLPSGPKVIEAPLPHDFDHLRRFGGHVRVTRVCSCSFAPVWWETYPRRGLEALKPCGSVPTEPNDHAPYEGWRSRALWWAGCWPRGSVR